MSTRALEDRLFDAVWQRNEADVRLAISTALTMARREGYADGVGLTQSVHTGTAAGLDLPTLAANRYSLPVRTVRKLREEPDPHNFGTWRASNLSERGLTVTHAMPGRATFDDECPPLTIERARLALDLLQRPYHEESVPVDPSEVLP